MDFKHVEGSIHFQQEQKWLKILKNCWNTKNNRNILKEQNFLIAYIKCGNVKPDPCWKKRGVAQYKAEKLQINEELLKNKLEKGV